MQPAGRIGGNDPAAVVTIACMSLHSASCTPTLTEGRGRVDTTGVLLRLHLQSRWRYALLMHTASSEILATHSECAKSL